MTHDEACTIWESLPHPSRDHVIRLFARKNSEVLGDFARNAKEIYRFANAYNGEYNCYICPNPTLRADGTRHRADDVTHWSYFFFDIDPLKGVENADPVGALDSALAAFTGISGHNLFEHSPTIIDSGRGMQAWFRGVDYDLEKEPQYRGMSRRAMSYWLGRVQQRIGTHNGCKLDPSVSDLPRPMRLPGTINLKTGREAKVLKFQEKPFPWLQFLLVGGCPKEILIQPELPQAREGARWQEVFKALTITAQDYLQTGAEQPGRHRKVWHSAKTLAERGVGRGQAAKAIYRANKLRGKDEELSPAEIEHALDTAYGRQDEESILSRVNVIDSSKIIPRESSGTSVHSSAN